MSLFRRLLARFDRTTTTEQMALHMAGCRCPRMGALVNGPNLMLVTSCEGHLPVQGWTPDVCQHHAHTFSVPKREQLFRLTEGNVVVQYEDGRED